MNHIKNFLMLLRELQKIDPEFPLQYAVCLGTITLDEGLSISELAEKTRLSLSTVSRIVGALSNTRQKGEAYGLIQVKICPQEKRKKELYLSAKGRLFMDSIASLLENQQSTAKSTSRIATAV
ncbi:MAG: MarR family winged helix-turn-helix transcriptional regulator [Alphaproteobacteria bacterium]